MERAQRLLKKAMRKTDKKFLQPKNKTIMKPNSFTQEILLVTTSSFSQMPFCARDSKDKSSHLSPAEQLEAACWNGLLSEVLPEIMQDSPCAEKIYLWQVKQGVRI